ncbi:hypothetical protein ACFS07_35795 [Undibacterium arcticum]
MDELWSTYNQLVKDERIDTGMAVVAVSLAPIIAAYLLGLGIAWVIGGDSREKTNGSIFVKQEKKARIS